MDKKDQIKKFEEKGKGFFDEFKAFALKGNVMDMAIGVIIGAAFSDVVTVLTKDIINPLINGIGGAKFGGSINIYGGQKILIGDFITSVINFFLMAFVLFILLKFFNRLASIGHKKEDKTLAKSAEVKLLEEIRDELKEK